MRRQELGSRDGVDTALCSTASQCATLAMLKSREEREGLREKVNIIARPIEKVLVPELRLGDIVVMDNLSNQKGCERASSSKPPT